jgi:hypothetical protein
MCEYLNSELFQRTPINIQNHIEIILQLLGNIYWQLILLMLNVINHYRKNIFIYVKGYLMITRCKNK